MSAQKILFIGRRIYGPPILQPHLFVLSDPSLDLLCNTAGDFAVEREYIDEVAVESLSPEVPLRRRAYELYGYANLVPRMESGTFHDGIHIQFFRYLRNSFVRILKRICRDFADYSKAFYFPEFIYE